MDVLCRFKFYSFDCRVYFPASFWLLFLSELSDLPQVVRPDQGWTQEKKGGMWLGPPGHGGTGPNGDETLQGGRRIS